MKKALYAGILLLLVSSAAFAQLLPHGYMALCTDQTAPPDFSNTCGTTGVPFYPVEMYIWCLPSNRGQICAEFMVDYPVNIIQSTVTTSPLICVTLGTLDTGMSACLCRCTYSWTWYFHQLLYVTDSTQTCVKIVKHPDENTECIRFANCDPGWPDECVTVLTSLCVNQECPQCIGTEESSWGAIKNLYKK